MKLNLGCGSKKIYGFTNVDIRPETEPDIIDNISTLKKIKNNSVEIIYACHALEHFSRHEYKKVLKRWYDILIYKGVLRLCVPDLSQVMKHYLFHNDLNIVLGFLYGGQTNEFNYHKMGWDFNTLKKDLINIGYKNITQYDWKQTEHNYIDDYSQSYLPHLDKINGMLLSLNVEAQK